VGGRRGRSASCNAGGSFRPVHVSTDDGIDAMDLVTDIEEIVEF
jgi:hypothetical protein